MRKNILATMFLIMVAMFSQTVMSQSIIMGSAPQVLDIDDQSRDFYDPGGVPGEMGANQDPDGYFAQGLRDTMTLGTNMTGTVLYVLFEEFLMGDGDTLWIFNGDNVDAPLYGVYNLVQSPGEITAAGRKMTFVFHSDSMDIPGLRAGWRAKVYAYSTTPETHEWPSYYNTIVVGTCNAWFYDSGGPNGNIASNDPNNYESQGYYENIHVDFYSPAGTHVKCEFTQFSVNGVMQIYDGLYADPNKRLIGQFCTSTLDASTSNRPPTLFSTGNALSFVYLGANGDTQKAGWTAEITCVAELFDSPDGSACPQVQNDVDSIYADLFDAENKTILWDCDIPIILLKAGVIATGQYTSDYSVKQIPYDENNMLFAYNEGQPIGASSDDNWLSGVQLPFTFTFFGKPYTTVYPGTNGLISMTPQSGYCTYSYSQPPASPPYSSIPYVYKNCVYGVYEDIDCRYYINKNDGFGMGNVRVGVLGSPPCRAFVFNYLNVGLYGHSSSTQTQPINYNTYQMVLYEGTNIIDVYVKHRQCCATTNSSGEGIIGLQNTTSSQILLAPGRGMSSWSTDNEAWRFTPITPLDEQGTLRWFVNDTMGTPYSYEKMITVSKPDTTVTKYISVYQFTNASGQFFTLMDTTTILVKVPNVHVSSTSGSNPICPGDPATLSATFTEYPEIHPESYRWSTGDTTATITVNPLQSTTYTLTVTFDDGYMSNCTVALPILREFGMKAVVSVVTSYMGDTENGFLTWDACREMAQSGLIEFGSHTHALHKTGIGRLSGESRSDYEQRVAEDLDRSVQLIEQEIGQKNVSFFAYPHGVTEAWASKLLRQRFDMTVTTEHGKSVISASGLYDLPRYNINAEQTVDQLLR